MQIELTEREIKRIVPILKARYQRTLNLWESIDIKGVLEKLGEKIEDWTPHIKDIVE